MTEKPSMYRLPADLSTSAPRNPNGHTEEGRAIYTPPAASPTGIPFLPPKAVPWVVAVVGIAGVLSGVLPEHTIGDRIAEGVVWLGALLGIASPGLRRR